VRETDVNRVYGVVLAATTVNGALLDSWWDTLDGGTTYDNTSFLFTDTARDDRKIIGGASWGADANEVTFIDNGDGQAPFSIMGADGAYMSGGLHVIARNGTPAGTGANALPGAERSCAFFGEFSHGADA
jgi:hypothetical protein